MRKIIILFVLFLLASMLPWRTIAQGSQSFENKVWTVQNLKDKNIYTVYAFSDIRFEERTADLLNKKFTIKAGKFFTSGRCLLLSYEDGTRTNFKFKLTPDGMLEFYEDGDNIPYRLAVIDSDKDLVTIAMKEKYLNNSKPSTPQYIPYGGYSASSSSYGSYGSGSSGTERCAACYGTSQCQVCRGSGLSQAPDYTGTRTSTPPCNNCNGSGKCPKCGGTGRK